MSTEEESIAEQLRIPPTTIDEAERQLELIKLAKKQLNAEMDYVMDQQRQERDEYSAQANKGEGRGEGAIRLISKDAANTLRGFQRTLDDYHRRGLAEDLEPLEAERAMLQAAIYALDERALELETWITWQELYPPAEGETVPPPGTRVDGQIVIVPEGEPETLEEAEAQLEMMKLREKELRLEEKKVVEAQRLEREANTRNDRKGSTRGKGPVALFAPNVADTLDDAQDSMDDIRDRRTAKNLEPLDDQRAAIEEEIHEIEMEQAELEAWIAREEARLEAEEKAQKEAEAAAEKEEEEAKDASSAASAEDAAVVQAQAEAELAKAEAEKAQAEAEKAQAEAEKAQAEAEKAKAEAEKAKAEAEAATKD